MLRQLKRLRNGERGQALAIVLALLALGGLTIAVNLNYATTSLKGTGVVKEDLKGIYAAGAGIEHVLWALRNNQTLATVTPENINQMAVSMQTIDRGTFTLYYGELIDVDAVHYDWLDVTGNITDLGGGTYRYTITVTWQPGSGQPSIKLEEVGARLPVGYSYVLGSAIIPGNLRVSNPTSTTTDEYGAYLVKWDLGTPRPEVSANQTTRTQVFSITGTGSTGGHYANVLAQPDSIGPVGEITATRYSVTANATRPGDSRPTARVAVELMKLDDGSINILSWKTTK